MRGVFEVLLEFSEKKGKPQGVKMKLLNNFILLLFVAWLIFGVDPYPLKGQVSSELQRWDLMIDEAHIWHNLVDNYFYSDAQKYWPERKAGLEKILEKYPESRWADELINICSHDGRLWDINRNAGDFYDRQGLKEHMVRVEGFGLEEVEAKRMEIGLHKQAG